MGLMMITDKQIIEKLRELEKSYTPILSTIHNELSITKPNLETLFDLSQDMSDSMLDFMNLLYDTHSIKRKLHKEMYDN